MPLPLNSSAISSAILLSICNFLLLYMKLRFITKNLKPVGRVRENRNP